MRGIRGAESLEHRPGGRHGVTSGIGESNQLVSFTVEGFRIGTVSRYFALTGVGQVS